MAGQSVEWYIEELVEYAVGCGLIGEDDRIFARNQLLEVMQQKEFHEGAAGEAARGDGLQHIALEEILAGLLADAEARGVIPAGSVTSRDLFDTKLMGCLMPRPSEVIREFGRRYASSPAAATDYFYQLSQDCDYIRRYRIARDMKWKAESPYGRLDITINLSKPEKDPLAIAAARTAKQSAYPKCQLCGENVGYAGRLDHPARQTLRTIPLTLGGEAWQFQYSPYVYYPEHCIAFCGEHRPMKIDRASFVRLFDFLDRFPHYFIGSNADLPIVGGSILTHDHFQGGHYEFAMERAETTIPVQIHGYGEVEAGIVKWPMSVLRIRSAERARLEELAAHVLAAWRGYTDEAAGIFAETDGTPHNTITPIARKRGGKYELDLVLRNNRTTEEFPLGIFHPHQELHHIKKENIGLIEVMGLAVLPSRLQGELEAMKKAVWAGHNLEEDEKCASHAAWLREILAKHPGLPEASDGELDGVLKEAIGQVFVRVLEDAGVFKWTPEGNGAFRRFLDTL